MRRSWSHGCRAPAPWMGWPRRVLRFALLRIAVWRLSVVALEAGSAWALIAGVTLTGTASAPEGVVIGGPFHLIDDKSPRHRCRLPRMLDAVVFRLRQLPRQMSADLEGGYRP